MAMYQSYFKTEFSGMPEKDPEEHILRMIDWMDTHNFGQGQKVQLQQVKPDYSTSPYNHFKVIGKNYRRDLGLNFQRKITQENSCFMCGKHSTSMKM